MTERDSENKYETRNVVELFGPAGGFIGKVNGIDLMYKVANEYDEFVANLETHGLGVSASDWASGDKWGIITNGNEGLDFPFHFFQKEDERGVWISDIEWYERLMKVKK